MKTTILITEQQKRRLIIESLNDEVNENIGKNVNIFKKISQFSSEEFSNNLGFLITWGAGIGGFMNPVNDFLYDVLDKIKENGLSKEFKETLDKAKNLKSTFISFLKSIDINVGSIMTMLSYAFMIPSIGPIIHLIQSGNVSHDEVKLFVSSLGMSKLITLSSKTLSVFIRNLIEKLK